MYFGPEMMLGMVAIVEENPVVDLPIATHSPGDWLVRISAVVTEVSIQVAETMAQIEKGKKKQHVTPVNEPDRVRRNDQRHQEQYANKRRQLDCAPPHIRASAFG